MARTKTRSKKSASGVTRSSERITAVSRRWRVETVGLTVPSLTAMSTTPPELPDDEVHVLRLGSGDRARAASAVREVLARYLGASPDAIRIVAGPHGKPELAGGELSFNLSHSGDIALVAVARARSLGVDVERIDPRRDVSALARRALDPAAATAVLALPAAERPVAFHRAWARREALAKCAGTGLGTPPPAGPRQVCDLDVGEGYAAALAVDGAAPVRVRVLDGGA